ncbi:RidA family protein [uncultured Croceitalea sp.]|uniref:RidA family protein n=1 Tax=uncultured Croceitalea sp. TaxID=1798908 RepID=UPI00330656C3
MKPIYFLLALVMLSCNNTTSNTDTTTQPVPKEKAVLNKTYVEPHNGYSEAVAIKANGIKTIYISGQVGEGATFEAQFRDALNKLLKTLKVSGATFDDVVKYNTYIVNYSPEMLPAFRAVRKELMGDTDMPASTLVGVEALGLESWGVEIEAIAVLAD